jgi:hypothetical protein
MRPLGDVVDEVVPPKSQDAMLSSDVATLESRFATVASYVDDDGALTWAAMSAKFWVVWGFAVFILMFRETHVCSGRHSMWFRGVW